MKQTTSFLACLICLAAGCSQTDAQLVQAERFIDAFYSFEPGAVRATLNAPADVDRVLYYQAWAQAAHYHVQTRRPCTLDQPGVIQCRITVVDDFGTALGYTATDTFTLSMAGADIAAVQFEGDDPPVFMALFRWIEAQRPEVMAGPCRDMFAGGETPAACAQAVAAAARVFAVAEGARSLSP